MSWSADGGSLLYMLTGGGGPDLWVKSMTGDGAPGPFLATPFREMWSAFSPDGRWVAYTSDESGRNEIYVRPFLASGDPRQSGPKQATGGQWQVSAAGGGMPVWRRDSRELYFLSPTGEMMAAPIAVTGATLEPGAVVRLFQTRNLGETARCRRVHGGNHVSDVPLQDGPLRVAEHDDGNRAPGQILPVTHVLVGGDQQLKAFVFGRAEQVAVLERSHRWEEVIRARTSGRSLRPAASCQRSGS